MLPENMKLFEAAGVLRARKINGAPVVNENGALVGVITEIDLFNFIEKLHAQIKGKVPYSPEEIKSLQFQSLVRNAMTANPVTVKKDFPLNELLNLMTKRSIHIIPVMSDDGKAILGIIDRHDVILAYLVGDLSSNF